MVVSLFIRGVIGKRNNVIAIGSKTHLGFHRFWIFRQFASNEFDDAIKISTNEYSFTVNCLVHSCGLSIKSAQTVSKKVHLKSRERADSFLNLLQKHGFTDSQVSKIVRSQPHLLLCDVEKIVLPKLEFFAANGIVNSKLTKLISSRPIILSCSLENRIIPGYNFVKGVLVRDDFVVKAMSRSWIIAPDVQKITAPNISHLREIGLPQSSIIQFVKGYPSALGLRPEKFEKKTQKVIDMGFNPKKMKFVKALVALACQRESNWEARQRFIKDGAGLKIMSCWLSRSNLPA